MQPENEILFNSLTDLEPIKEKIGKGSFAQVKLVRHKESGAILALKEIDLSNSLNYREESKLIEREIKIHKDLQHPNIIRLYDSLQIKKKYYLLLEFAHHGDLYKLLVKKKRIHEKDVAHITYQLCKSLQHIHKKGVVHRDLKLENQLVDKKGKIKLCDFGWCTDRPNLRKTFCGTFEYMAPEMINRGEYNYTVDIWSIGIIIYELIHGFSPFKGNSAQKIFDNIRNYKIKFSSKISKEAKDQIKLILRWDPKDRPNIETIMEQDFYTQNIQSSYNSKDKTEPFMESNKINTDSNGYSNTNPFITNDNTNGKDENSFQPCMNTENGLFDTKKVKGNPSKDRLDDGPEPMFLKDFHDDGIVNQNQENDELNQTFEFKDMIDFKSMGDNNKKQASEVGANFGNFMKSTANNIGDYFSSLNIGDFFDKFTKKNNNVEEIKFSEKKNDVDIRTIENSPIAVTLKDNHVINEKNEALGIKTFTHQNTEEPKTTLDVFQENLNQAGSKQNPSYSDTSKHIFGNGINTNVNKFDQEKNKLEIYQDFTKNPQSKIENNQFGKINSIDTPLYNKPSDLNNYGHSQTITRIRRSDKLSSIGISKSTSYEENQNVYNRQVSNSQQNIDKIHTFANSGARNTNGELLDEIKKVLKSENLNSLGSDRKNTGITKTYSRSNSQNNHSKMNFFDNKNQNNNNVISSYSNTDNFIRQGSSTQDSDKIDERNSKTGIRFNSSPFIKKLPNEQKVEEVPNGTKNNKETNIQDTIGTWFSSSFQKLEDLVNTTQVSPPENMFGTQSQTSQNTQNVSTNQKDTKNQFSYQKPPKANLPQEKKKYDMSQPFSQKNHTNITSITEIKGAIKENNQKHESSTKYTPSTVQSNSVGSNQNSDSAQHWGKDMIDLKKEILEDYNKNEKFSKNNRNSTKINSDNTNKNVSNIPNIHSPPKDNNTSFNQYNYGKNTNSNINTNSRNSYTENMRSSSNNLRNQKTDLSKYYIDSNITKSYRQMGQPQSYPSDNYVNQFNKNPGYNYAELQKNNSNKKREPARKVDPVSTFMHDNLQVDKY